MINNQQSEIPKVSISIVVYNSSNVIEKCLSQLIDYLPQFSEIIVVDNDSPDDSAEIVSKKFPLVKVIKSDKNLGFAGGHNLAKGIIKGEYWFILNPDAFLEKNGLAKLVEIMNENPEIGILSPNIVNSEKSEISNSLAFPSIIIPFLEVTRLLKLFPGKIRGKLLKVPSLISGDLIELDWVPGTAVLARKEIIDKVGSFSEDFFMYAEDVELCWRIKNNGWKVVMAKNIRVEHIGGVSSKNKTRNAVIEKSIPSYYLADSRMVGRKKAFIIHLLRTIAYGIESLRFGASKEYRNNCLAIFKASLKFIFKKNSISNHYLEII